MKDSFFEDRLKAFGFASKGILKLFKSEPNFKVQGLIAVVMIVLGFVFQISKMEWLFQILAIGFVLGSEALNSAIEKLADALHPDWNLKIGWAKDAAAAGVLLVTVAAIAIGLVIYWPYVF